MKREETVVYGFVEAGSYVGVMLCRGDALKQLTLLRLVERSIRKWCRKVKPTRYPVRCNPRSYTQRELWNPAARRSMAHGMLFLTKVSFSRLPYCFCSRPKIGVATGRVEG